MFRPAVWLLLATLAHGQPPLPVRPMWRTYPVYHPDKAPPDYIEWLRTQDPQQIWNPEELKTDADWIRAGEAVYEAPIVIGSIAARPPSDPPYLQDKTWFDKINPPIAHDGSITGFVYVLRVKGKVEIGALSCAGCHNRVMSNGAVIRGAQGNFPIGAAMADDFLASAGKPDLVKANKALFRRLFYQPSMKGEEAALFDENLSILNLAKTLTGNPPGVMAVPGATPWNPVQVPSLIGVQDQHFLGNEGKVENNGPGDIARYVAAKQAPFNPESRYSDDQLKALAMYLTSLKAPPSPVKADKTTRLGEKIFQREGCAECHSPPSYTSPKKHVPSLRGLWFRAPLGSSGAVASLEEWMSPTRLTYLTGHEYGLKLSGTDRFALIAFLRTL